MKKALTSRPVRLGALGMAAAGLAFAVTQLARAGDTPDAQTMVYRGHLEQNGATYNGQVNLGFDFYDGSGNCLDAPPGCPSVPSTVTVLGGEFSVALILPPAVLASQTPAIQVSINGTPLQGQQRIYPVPFSQRGRANGHFVAEDAVDVVTTGADAGPTVEIGGARLTNPVPGREIDFAQVAGDDAKAGSISYCGSFEAGQPAALDIIGTGAGTSHLVRISDDLIAWGNASTNNLYVRGDSLSLGSQDGLLGSPGSTFGNKPALFHDGSDTLNVNYQGAFSGGTQVGSNLTVTGNESVNGSLTENANVSGGNVPHQCVMRSTTNSCSVGNGGAQCTLAQCAAYCNSGEIAVGGGGSCTYNWRVMDDQPWGGSGAGGAINNGDSPTAWSVVCQVYGNGGASACPQPNWVECCKY